MKIKGSYRDVISKNGTVIRDSGWRSNIIVQEFGNLLAYLLKKDFLAPTGIDYIAVGSTRDNLQAFRERIKEFFEKLNTGSDKEKPLFDNEDDNNWVWAKKIESDSIQYFPYDPQKKEVTNCLQIEEVFGRGSAEPETRESLVFGNFALLGIDKDKEGNFDTNNMYLINFVEHGEITKSPGTIIIRTIRLTFPIQEGA
jgi:hypothetical protein